jgi:hypothetical protein
MRKGTEEERGQRAHRTMYRRTRRLRSGTSESRATLSSTLSMQS